MKKGKKTTGQRISELAKLHRRIVELEQAEAEYKLQEKNLRKSKERFKKTFVSQLDALFILDANNPPRILDCNPSAARVFGHSRKKMLGRTTDFLHVDRRSRRRFQDQLHPAIAKHGFFHLPEFEMKRNDGTVFPTEHTVVSLEDDRGKRIGWVSTIRDISQRKQAEQKLEKAHEELEHRVAKRTAELLRANEELKREIAERKQAEEALRESEEKYHDLYELTRLTIDNVPDLIWAKNMDDQFILVNQAICDKLLMCDSKDQAIGKTDMFFAERERNADFQHTFGEICVNSDFITKERKAPGRFLEDGLVRNKYLVLDVHKAPLLNKDGEMIGTVGCGRDVTKEKETEEALQKSEEFSRTLLETMADRVFAKDSQGRYTLLNKTSYDFWDIPYGTALGKTDWDIHDPVRAEVFTASDRIVFATGEPYFGEEGAKTKDGRDLVLSVTKAPLKDATGKITGLVGISRDITAMKKAEEALRRAHDELQARVEERTARLKEANEQLRQQITEHKRAEEELRESEERFRKAFDYAALGMVLVSPGGRFLKVNSYFCQMVGYTEGELLNRTFNDVTHPDDYHIGLDVLSQVVDGKVPYAWAEKRYLHKDGRVVWGMLSTSAIRDAMDNAVYLVSHIQDITERKQAEEALIESEERYSSLFKNNHSVMLLINPQNAAIVDANPAACSFYGWSHEELTSRKITDVNTLTREQVCREMKRAQSGKAQHFLFQHRLANDEIRDVEVYSGPITIEGKQLLYSIIHDISERRLAEEQLQKAHTRLEQRAVELSQLNEKLKQEIEERKMVEQKLREREAELKSQAGELGEVNSALRVLLKQREKDKTELEEKVLDNVNELVVPYVERLKSSGLDAGQTTCVSILESNLHDIVSSFAHSLSSKYLGLTPTEIQIANLVKQGMTSKEIAEILHSAHRTVEFHRKNIRKKMGIVNRKVNLRSHLLAL